VTSLAVVLVLLWAGVAAAGFPQSIKEKVPAGGTGEATSSAVPSTAKQGTIEVDPTTNDDTFKHLALVLSKTPSKAKRLLTCLEIALSPLPYADGPEDFEDTANTLFALFLKGCIDLAMQLPVKQAAAFGPYTPTATTPGCSRLAKSISITITHANGKYTLHAHGTTHKPSGTLPAQISCRRKGHGALLTVKSSTKGKTLRQAVGPNLRIGFANRTKKTLGVKTTFAVK
jgi:hypothetical protein